MTPPQEARVVRGHAVRGHAVRGHAVRGHSPLLVAFAAGVIAFTAQMLWVRQFAVSIPFWDEWADLHGFLAAWHAGGLTWQDFFSQHMEHRIPVARVCFILVDAVYGEGNMIGNLTLHALLMAGIVMIWVYTLRRLGEPLWLVGATLVVLMSPCQYENWLWGFQVEFFTLVGVVVAAICWIALAAKMTWAGVAGCALACAVSSYSIASGLSSWAAVGVTLLLRVRLDRGSWRGLLSARREAAQLLVFLAAGIFVTAAYFRDYVQLHPMGAEGRVWAQMAQWAGAALVFPLIDPLSAAEIRWLPAAIVLVFGPIAGAMVLYARRGDRPRLLLTIGVLLMVAGNAGIMTLGRSGVGFVASRYGTVFLWTAAISLLAVSSLVRASRGRGRAIAIPIGLAGAILVGTELWRYTRFVDPIRETRRGRLVWEYNVTAYLSDDSPDRQMPAAYLIPFPEAPIKPLLHQRHFLATLPYNLRPPARVATSGNAWSLQGVTAAAGVPGPFTWGSWTGSDAHTGTLTSTPFPAPRGLTLAVSGYPTRPGNSLAIESVVDPKARLVYSGPDPGDRWMEWHVERDHLPAGRVRVVAVDGRQADGAWVGIQFPVDRPAAARVLEAILRHLPFFSAGLLALIGAWAYRRHRGSVRNA